jgi:RNA recognition motif-containing protein
MRYLLVEVDSFQTVNVSQCQTVHHESSSRMLCRIHSFSLFQGESKVTKDKVAVAIKEEPTEESAVESTTTQEKNEVDTPTNATGTTNTRVYVGNLAWSVSWQDLKDHMKSTGLEVTRADVMTTHDGRSKGCGVVEFSTAAEAQEAVHTLHDTELKGRPIFVREDREDRTSSTHAAASATTSSSNSHGGHRTAGEQTRRVYVGNLSWDVAWQDLKDHMRQAGEVTFAEVITEYNGRSKGCGIVEYATEEAAKHAIATLSDTELKGRMIFVREDREHSSGTAHGNAPQKHQATSVYVSNLSTDTSWQDLKDHMRKAGNVDSATIMTNAQGESLGCAVVVYQRPQEASRAIRELQHTELHGQTLYVREDRVPAGRGGRGGRGPAAGGRGGRGGGGRGGSQLFVGNLSLETSWRDLKDHFKTCGDVKRAEVVMNSAGESKGFGTVQFFQSADAESAIQELNGSELNGNTIEVRMDQRAR